MMSWFLQGFGRIEAANGVFVAVMGMGTVFLALTLITLFITLLPRALHAIAPLPEEDELEAQLAAKKAAISTGPSAEAIAAIGVALHAQLSQREKR